MQSADTKDIKGYYIRNRALRNRRIAKPKQKEATSWTCPHCSLQLIQDPEARADQLSRKRLCHLRTAHPDKPQPNLCKKRKAIEASTGLPETNKAWVCPTCLKHDSIRKHIADHHPDETLRSLSDKQARAKLPPWHQKHITLTAKLRTFCHNAAIKQAKQHGHMPATAPDDTLGAKCMPDKAELYKKFPARIMILCHNCWRSLLGSSARRKQCPKKVDIHLHHRIWWNKCRSNGDGTDIAALLITTAEQLDKHYQYTPNSTPPQL